eukprot:COSAG02_NODE_7694_length_2889_cov_19.079570_2_plen_333_part_00
MAALVLTTMLGVVGVQAASEPCLRLGLCSEPSAKWSWNQQTHAVTPTAANGADRAAGGGGGCLTATGVHTTEGVGELVLQPCNATDANQRWVSAQGTVELLDSPGLGWVSEKDTKAGELVWLYDLRPGGPSNNTYCKQAKNCAFTWDGRTFKNPAGNCVVLGPAGPPPAPPPSPSMPTCAPGSPVEHERFCDASLSFEVRAQVLVSNLTLDEKLDLWTVNTMARSIPRLNIKGFKWDSTCIHGGPFVGATVGPHAINQGATFDTLLVEAMSNATADEMRANSIRTMQQSRGQGPIDSLSCDGGPLANSAHDPRWGRISETYGAWIGICILAV